MNEMTIVGGYIDSRELAAMIGKRHDNLVRDIDGYVEVLGHSSNLSFDSYFVESTYMAGTGKEYRCYHISRKGCEFVANKMTGKKGIQFTAAYIERFHEMEGQLKKAQYNIGRGNAGGSMRWEKNTARKYPTLGMVTAIIRFVGMKRCCRS